MPHAGTKSSQRLSTRAASSSALSDKASAKSHVEAKGKAKRVRAQSASGKRVTLPEVVKPQDNDILSPARQRTKNLLAALHDLRRITCPMRSLGTDKAIDTCTQSGRPGSATNCRTTDAECLTEKLIQSTLHEAEDDIDSLEDIERIVESAMGPVSNHGGSRHATNCMFRRVLAIVRRKKFLLRTVDDRTIAYEVAHARRREYYSQLVAGRDEFVPPELLDIRKFITANTYRPGSSGGTLIAENRDAESLGLSFMLPIDHKAMVYLRTLIAPTSQWWVEATLREAESGASSEVIKRLTSVAVGAGADRDHPLLIQSLQIQCDRLAEAAADFARKAQTRDAELASRTEQAGEVPQVGVASKAAEEIRDEIARAVAESVPKGHQQLTEAARIAKELEHEDARRRRLAGRLMRERS